MATDQLLARDAVIRQAAFDHVRALQSRDPVLSHEVIKEGFQFEGKRWPLVNPQRGIFKPGPMPFLLSIRTVFPKKGGRVWYDDQRNVHRQIFAGEEVLDYAFMGRDPVAPENTWLREAADRQIPLVYFLGVSPGRYQAIVPTFVVDWNARRLNARIAFGELAGATLVSSARAVEKGLRFRTLETTVRDTLAWHAKRPAEQQQKLRAGFAPDREAQLLKLLKA